MSHETLFLKDLWFVCLQRIKVERREKEKILERGKENKYLPEIKKQKLDYTAVCRQQEIIKWKFMVLDVLYVLHSPSAAMLLFQSNWIKIEWKAKYEEAECLNVTKVIKEERTSQLITNQIGTSTALFIMRLSICVFM